MAIFRASSQIYTLIFTQKKCMHLYAVTYSPYQVITGFCQTQNLRKITTYQSIIFCFLGMNGFDRIKIVTDKKYINNMDCKISTLVMQNNVVHEERIKQIKPFNLYVSTSQFDSKGIIEVSAKVLGDRYPELINKNNIHYIFERINALGICELDIDGIISESKLISCDITLDIDGVALPDSNTIKTCLKNINKFEVQKYTNCGLTVTKKVKTKNRQVRLSFYDKYKDMDKASNMDFLSSLDDKYALRSYFKDRMRIEANVKTVSQIKELCKTDDNDLMEVLNSPAKILLEIFDSIFDLPGLTEEVMNEKQSLFAYRKLSELKDALLVKACDNDPGQIDLVLNNCLSPNTNKGKYKNKLVKLIMAMPKENKNVQALHLIRNKLSMNLL